jgi:hypothetical protein
MIIDASELRSSSLILNCWCGKRGKNHKEILIVQDVNQIVG